MEGMHYNLDRSRCFYVTLLDLEEPEESHKEISELINTGHKQKGRNKKQTKGFCFVFAVIQI